MNRTRITLVLALTTLTCGAFAQQRNQTDLETVRQPARVSAGIAVRAAAVAPANDLPVLRSGDTPPPQQTRLAVTTSTAGPAPIAANRFQSLTGRARPATSPGAGRGGAGSLAAPDTTLQYLKLTPREPWSGWGHLEFNEVRHIDAEGDYALFYTATDPSMAFTRAYVDVQQGERYLIDVAVSVSREVTFSFGAGGNGIQTTVDDGDHHLLLYLEPHASKEISVMLFPDVADYVFHSLEITRVD